MTTPSSRLRSYLSNHSIYGQTLTPRAPAWRHNPFKKPYQPKLAAHQPPTPLPPKAIKPRKAAAAKVYPVIIFVAQGA